MTRGVTVTLVSWYDVQRLVYVCVCVCVCVCVQTCVYVCESRVLRLSRLELVVRTTYANSQLQLKQVSSDLSVS